MEDTWSYVSEIVDDCETILLVYIIMPLKVPFNWSWEVDCCSWSAPSEFHLNNSDWLWKIGQLSRAFLCRNEFWSCIFRVKDIVTLLKYYLNYEVVIGPLISLNNFTEINSVKLKWYSYGFIIPKVFESSRLISTRFRALKNSALRGLNKLKREWYS